jgi:hypothetical protein
VPHGEPGRAGRVALHGQREGKWTAITEVIGADEGAYDHYARDVNPLGDEITGAGAAHVAPHVNLSGDGFSAMGGESGFTGAYTARMQSLHDRVAKLGGGPGL